MRKFTINCSFSGTLAPFTIYVGAPEKEHHPLHFQSDWLSKERGGTVPLEVMDSFQKLLKIALENNVPFEDLCAYAIESTQAPSQTKEILTDQANSTKALLTTEKVEQGEKVEAEQEETPNTTN